MSKQRTLIAIDWLMPVLQDIFDELGGLLQSSHKPVEWEEQIAQGLHQVSGALILTNQPLLAMLSSSLEQAMIAINQDKLPSSHLSEIGQGMTLLNYEIRQLQQRQHCHNEWLIDRINYFNDLLGEPRYEEENFALAHSQMEDKLPLLPQLPVPPVRQPWQDEKRQKLIKLWRYCGIQLLEHNHNNPEILHNLAKLAHYLASTPLHPAFRQLWHLVSLWFVSQALNENPKPEQYAVLMISLEELLSCHPDNVPDLAVGRLAVDVLLQLENLEYKATHAQKLISTLDLGKVLHHNNLFSEALQKVEQVMFQLHDPQAILPILQSIRFSLANRGWVFYEQQLDQIISDTEIMAQDKAMASSMTEQVERQLQDLYNQLLETSTTLYHQIGLANFSYASSPEREAVRQTRLNLERVKLAFNSYTQTHNLAHLEIHDELVDIIQTFGTLSLVRPQELVEQLRLLISQLIRHHLTTLSWEVTDAIADTIAHLELFLDYLSYQSLNGDWLDKAEAQMNYANALVKQLIESPFDQKQLTSRQKDFQANAVVYDDEGEKFVDSVVMADDATEFELFDFQEQDNATDEHIQIDFDAYSLEFNDDDLWTASNSDSSIPVATPVSTDKPTQPIIKPKYLMTAEESPDIVPQDVTQNNEAIETTWFSGNTDPLPSQPSDQDEALTFSHTPVITENHPVPDTAEDIHITLGDVSSEQSDAEKFEPTPSFTPKNQSETQETVTTHTETTNSADFFSEAVDDDEQTSQAILYEAHKITEESNITDSPVIFEEEQLTEPLFDDTDNSVKVPATEGSQLTLPAVFEQEYQALNEVTDEAGDPDIQEIYIEEAYEVLDYIKPLFRTWQDLPNDFATLKEIRRGFHTLKGSGRMVGANELGELAWSLENMLNRVLDKTVTASAGVIKLTGDVIENFGDLVDIFAQNRTDYPHKLKIWTAIANAYAKHGGDVFDYDNVMSVAARLSNQATIEDEANVVTSLTDEKINSPTLEKKSEIRTQTQQVFLEESQELLGKIDSFISQNRGQSSIAISDDLVRAFHTLRGGAAISALPRVYALSSALEDNLGELMRKEVALHQEQLEILSQVKAELNSYIDDYREGHSVLEQPSDAQHIDNVIHQLLANIDSQPLNESLTVNKLLDLGIDELLNGGDRLYDVSTYEDESISVFAQVIEKQAGKLVAVTQGFSYSVIPEALQLAYQTLVKHPVLIKDKIILRLLGNIHSQLIGMFDAIAAGLSVPVDAPLIASFKQQLFDKQQQAELTSIEYEIITGDVELMSIFLDETHTLQIAIQKNVQQWQHNLANLETVKLLQKQFHTLKGGANMVGISSIATLALRGERLSQAIYERQLASNDDIINIVQQLYETISAQLLQVRLHQRSFFADKMVAELDGVLNKTLSPQVLTLSVPIIVDDYLKKEEVEIDEAKKAFEFIETNQSDNSYLQHIINNFEQQRLETWHGQEPDKDILAVFLEEAKELIDSSSQHLQEFRHDTDNTQTVQALQRELHTIKGGARMVGAEGVSNLAHQMETVYEELSSHRKPATPMIGELLAACHDWLADALTVLKNIYNPQTPTELITALQNFLQNPDTLKEVPLVSLTSQLEQIEIYHNSLQGQKGEDKRRDLSVLPSMNGNFESEQEQGNLNTEMVKISAEMMEQLINLSSESAISRSRIEMGVANLTHSIEEMGVTVQRLADQLRRMETELEIQILAKIGDDKALNSEFDPLEMDQYSALNQLSKSLSESASDLLDIKATMLERTHDTENLLVQMSRTQADLQESLMNSRTVPFSRITPRLQRIVRQTATELGKAVELRIINDEGDIDRNILDKITSPLEHMLRNAVDHGIETPQQRLELGKSATGMVTVEIIRDGSEIVIHLSDDGKGIDVEAVRKKAIEQGLIAENDTSLRPLDIMQYIFNAGLTTAKSVSQISGRGVGMDVVQSEVKQLGGVVLVDSVANQGSRFTMRLPLTVAVSDALVVRAGDKYYAVPLAQIERVVRIDTDKIYQFHAKNETSLDIDGIEYRMRYLNQILYATDPMTSVQQSPSNVPVIIIRTETEQNMALQVDEIAGSRIEIIVKPLGRQLSHIAGISAATIMGDGSVMLILDLIALMRNVSAIINADQQKITTPTIVRKNVVLIVDDSVTVRKVTSRLLERNGYDAQVATDGMDALEKLQAIVPDIILLDIEMPRIDGFEVARQVRHTERLKNVPIIMITSRTGEKHRKRAMSIGVNDYMGKPFQEQVLLDTINSLIQRQA